METLITIKPIDIDEVKINKTNPTTTRKTQVSKDVVEKFLEFKGTRKASINLSALKKVKPEINTDGFSEYEENLTLDQIFKKLGKSNAILVSKYGYTNLNVSPESLEKAVNESLEEPLKIIKQQEEEINLLKEENKKLLRETKAIKETIEDSKKEIINTNLNNIIDYPMIDDDNLDDLSLDEIDDNYKLVA